MILETTDAQLLHVSSEDIETHVDYDLAINAARTAALARATGTAHSCRTSLPFENGWMRLMGAEVASLGVFGYKQFHLAGGSTVRYAIFVFDTATGAPIGIVDAALVTTLRTAATAALAVEHCVGRGNPVRLGVVGTGAEALAGVLALANVIKIEEVRASSRQQANRDAFVASVGQTSGLAATAYASVEEALEDVALVYVATNSGGQVVLTAPQVANIGVIASIGSTLPAQRELSGQILLEADTVIIDTPDLLEESGDAIEARDAGWTRDNVHLLGSVLTDHAPPAEGTRTVYKSIGSPEQDIVLAHAILQAAEERGFGRRIEPLSAAKVNLA